MPIRSSKEEFIEKSQKIHGDKYDYSKVEYKNNKTKVCIICPEHGEFWQTPSDHTNSKSECPKCAEIKRANSRRKTFNEFLIEARMTHGYRYDYSKVDYVRNDVPICIICPVHGEFWQTPDNHISQKQGCPKCGGTKRLTQEEFVQRCREIHGDKYDYSKSVYKNMTTKVCIICPEHGEFWQSPLSHIHGKNGCKKCSRQYMDTEFFKEIGNKVHNGKYDYSKVQYFGGLKKVCIICPAHGEFWQTAADHLNGKGCPKCKASKMENAVSKFLDDNRIEYEFQKKFKWLKNKKEMPIDFFLPEINVAIECQGYHHFHPVYYSKTNKSIYELNFTKRKEKDKLKKQLCEENGIKVEYINYFEDCTSKLRKILEKYGAASKKEN